MTDDRLPIDNLKSRSVQQLELLQAVFDTIAEQGADRDLVYPLLRQNLDLLDFDIVEVFRDWIDDQFVLLDRDEKKSLCSVIGTFSNLIQEFSFNKAASMELAIECYLATLNVYTRKDLPIDWAITQNNLAIAYSNRIKGDRADNLELAIEYYRDALEIFTPDSFPNEWATIQVNLARFSIEQLQNYEFAAEHLKSAYIQITNDNSNAELLARTMFELGRCFHKTGCLSQAKIYFKDTIRLYQRLEQPLQVAAATSTLGNIELQMGHNYDARIHLQTALEFYQAVGNLERVASIQELLECLPEHDLELVL